MKVRIGYGLGTSGMAADGEGYARFIDDLERLDFDSVWFSERINGAAPDPVVAMSFAAGRTRNLKFGMSVMVLPGRNPVLVAKEMASLDVLSGGGRLLPAFGLGVADAREQSGFGVAREDRAAAFNESLAVIRRLWSEDSVSHDGRFFKFDNITVRPRPTKQLDVWMGGFAPSELRRVGRLSDGWLPSFITPAESGALAQKVRDAAAEAGRTIDPEHFGVLIPYSSGTPLGGALVERFRARRPDVSDPSALFPVGIAAIRAQINAFIEHGYSKFVLIPIVEPEDWTAELELLTAEVLPLET